MTRKVNKKLLIRYIRKHYGRFYTVPQIEKIIEEEGCAYFKHLNIKYLGFEIWEITE
jgi:sulfur relay (sulfurtransferase) DsrC/TusE family protein